MVVGTHSDGDGGTVKVKMPVNELVRRIADLLKLS
jgi:hypothetical protein